MKRTVLVLVLVGLSALAYGQANSRLNFATHHTPGNVMVGGDLGITVASDLSGSSLAVYPFAEMIASKIRLADFLSIDFGGAAVGRFGLGTGQSGFGLGAMATVHFGFRGSTGIVGGILDNIDLGTGVGLKVDIGAGSSGFLGLGLGLISTGAVNYYVTDNIAVRALGRYWGSGSDFSIGAFFELGPKEEISGGIGVFDPVSALSQEAILLQFQLLNSQLFALGGFHFDDRAYEPGVGVRWKFTTESGGEKSETELWKALLEEQPNGTRVWELILAADSRIEYRVTVDTSFLITELFYSDGERSETFVPSRPVFLYEASTEEISSEDYGRISVGRESVRVPAGRFTADHLVVDEDGARYDWWVDPNLPGNLVKLEWTDGGDKGYGEMVEIDRNYR